LANCANRESTQTRKAGPKDPFIIAMVTTQAPLRSDRRFMAAASYC